ncbi:hypothetical protein FN846DRAFT_895004 [Sphaerosporella brunnea]|uniref:Uncharacterized protein n=1 Tax=Sphaerosporella brunnea TaxID=1250544 RepID=A0A5J5EHD3_9PEZI|nr:hypothetical protein FN846DRAFT_895004 [Sphaerosporella brunnea]
MTIAVTSAISRDLLPYYIPRMPEEKRRLLTVALISGLPPARLGRILDVLVSGKESKHAKVVGSKRARGEFEDNWLPPPALGQCRIVPLVWGPNHPGDAVGILTGAAALGKVDVLKLLFNHITCWRDAAELLTTYPRPLHYTSLYAQPHAVRLVRPTCACHAGCDFFSAPPLPPDAPTAFCLAVLGFLLPGRTGVDVFQALNVLEIYPVDNSLLWYGGHWLTSLIRANIVLPVSILRVLLRCMPWHPHQEDQISNVFADLVEQDSQHSFRDVQMLPEAGAQTPVTCWVRIIQTSNHRLFARMVQNVPGYLPAIYQLWQHLLYVILTSFPWAQPRW